MNKKKNPTLIFLFVAAMSLLIFLAVDLTVGDAQPSSNRNVFDTVGINGEFMVDDGQWQPLLPESKFDISSNHTFLFRGHFSKEIEKNQLIMLRISDLWVRIRLNGAEVFAFGDDKAHSAGNVWQCFTSPGISTADTVEIELYNIYKGVHPFSVEQFLNEMHMGSMDGLYRTTFRENGFSMLIGYMILVLGIFELSGAAVLGVMKQREAYRIFCSGGFAVCSGIWFCIQFNVISLLIPFHRLIGAIDVLSAYYMSAFFAMYVSTYLTGKLKKYSEFNIFVTLSICMLTSFFALVPNVDAYHSIAIGWPITIANLVACLVYLFLEYKKTRRRMIANFGLSLIPLTVGVLLDYISVWAGVSNDTRWLRSCFLIFVLIQLVSLLWSLQENSKKAEQAQRLENELIQSRISITLSQIQPHFLYNSLTAIKHLCRINPQMAETAIVNFSNYLRGNLDSLSTEKLVLFERELKHIETYLALEKMRFGQNLQIVYDLRCRDFVLPVLTVQPLVENAVRYGVSKRRNGGTVTLSTEERDMEIIITVHDDGVGFNPLDAVSDGQQHIGIENVRSRLQAQCEGSLRVESTPGVGTNARITIPKEDTRQETNRKI